MSVNTSDNCVLRLPHRNEVYGIKTIQELLRDLREDHDLKQSDVANLIGTTQQQYSKYETGESELPLRVLAILTNRYNVSADYLMGRKINIRLSSRVPCCPKRARRFSLR